ncbi:NAD-dependent epimerase/dehydratase family protein [Pelodictyon luteolum]|uniref:NAD-dependent epimerase/dehydratase family protein/3-beta hydroxysteroid dehydrogenase/isomerase family protein n=1 Tax=Chlorobium luteolum (strain DSM 273 / BCRC 81028 / 2530) TaxID=319225 RepID=Q3B685_CHLL3|nr:NAD-dependent epimerase/dehydratase family protein [Pelodictyon luteolum]ABB23146.1 NAD-dependent epimerase/dehydratase family protein/3-beta hydroxysteroid dehydrogenase/isomerase family protein [Pelodictyon luteolum DSM 273]
MAETILVTGSTGFIGRRMLVHPSLCGERVRVLLRAESPVRDMPDGVEAIRADFLDPQALHRALSGVDRIIHLAGVTKAPDEPAFDEGNVLPVRNLLLAVRQHNPGLRRFVLVSSLAAAGPAREGIDGVREEDAPHPVSAYGRSKLRGEEAALEFAGDVPLTILRPPAVYGPGDRDVLQVFQMLRNGVLVTAGNARRQRFSMIHVDDLVRGIMMAARAESPSGRIYNITSSVPWSWDGVVAAARPALGLRNVLRISLPAPAVMLLGTLAGKAASVIGRTSILNRDKAVELLQDYWVSSPRRAAEELGFTSEITPEEGVAGTIAWARRDGLL